MLKLKLFFIFAILAIQSYESLAQKNVVCYYTNWSQYRNEGGKFYPENIDPFLCTHIIYAFAKITNGQLAPFEWNDESTDWSKGMYERTIDLKKINPNLKILLAVGGWTMESTDFSNMVTTDAARASFITTSIAYLKKHKFDGLDLDWEYPSNRLGSRPSDRVQFTKLVAELKTAFKSQNLLLTAAVAAGKSTIDSAYEVDKIAKDLDFINLMSYDLHGSWESFTGHHAALYPRNSETDAEQRLLNVDFALNYWIQLGTPREKINLGAASYGRTFRLVSTSQTGLGASASGPGTAGTFTREAGFVSYYEVCQKLQTGYSKVFNSEHLAPYAYFGNDWIGYDDIQSIEIKAQYVKNLNLGGIMFWALDTDDFTGNFCGQGKFPLINAAKNILNGGSIGSTSNVQTTTTSNIISTGSGPSSTSSTSTISTTQVPVTGDIAQKCKNGNGYYPDLASGCKEYYVCLFFGTQWQSIQYFTCPPNTIFDVALGSCNYEANTVCRG